MSSSPRVFIASTPLMLSLLVCWAAGLAISFPRPGFWAPAHLALVPLILVATRGKSLRKTALLIYLVALVWWVWMLRWLIDVTGPGYLALAAYCAIYPLLFALVLRLVGRALHLPLTFVVPVLWVATEYLRGTVILTGFPWFNLGHTQPVWLIQIADVVGAYGVSFIVAMTSGLVGDLLTNRLVAKGGGLGRTIKPALLGYGLILAAAIGYGQWRLSQSAVVRADQRLRVSVVQTDVPQSNKNFPSEEQSVADFNAMLQLSEQAMKDDPQLIVWPETMVPRAMDDDSLRAARISLRHLQEGGTSNPDELAGLRYWAATLEYYRDIVEMVIRHRVYLIFGAHAFDRLGEADQKRFNSAYLFAPNGQQLDRYDKVHRVPFGEYILFEESLPAMANLLRSLAPLPGYSLSAGQRLDPLHLTLPGVSGGEPIIWAMGTPICFEDVFSEECRRMIYVGGQKRAQILVNLTNDGWYPDTDQPLQHEQIARLRCVENRVPMARAVNRGVSALIDSSGRIVAKVQVDSQRQSVAGVAGGELARDDRATIFGRWGDWLSLCCTVLSALLLVLGLGAARLKRSQS